MDMQVCAHDCICLWRPEEVVKSLELQVVGSYPLGVLRTEPRSSEKQFVLITTELTELSLQSQKLTPLRVTVGKQSVETRFPCSLVLGGV